MHVHMQRVHVLKFVGEEGRHDWETVQWRVKPGCCWRLCGGQPHEKNITVDISALAATPRIAHLQGVSNNYETDLIFPIVAKAAAIAGVDYASAQPAVKTALKVRARADVCVPLCSASRFCAPSVVIRVWA